MPLIVVDFLLGFTLISLTWIIGYLFFRLSEKLGFVNSLLMRNSHFFSLMYDFLKVEWFGRLLVNTPLRYTSEKMRLRNHGSAELFLVRHEMVDSEVSHHCGFWLCLLAAISYLLNGGRGSLFVVLSFYNVLGNLYPVLVQIRNRSRIDKILEHRKKDDAVLPRGA
jgi:hypothetical protein